MTLSLILGVPAWLAGELEDLPRSKPDNGEEAVKQVYLWRHDTLKTWALALFAGALTFIATAALAALKSEVTASTLTVSVLVGEGAIALVAGLIVLMSLRRVVEEYLVAVQLFRFYAAAEIK